MENRNLECPQCGTTFGNEEEMRRHSQTAHGGKEGMESQMGGGMEERQ